MKTLKELLNRDGLYAVRVKDGAVLFSAQIPEDHLILSVEAFIEYLKRLGFTVSR
ncbi:hypothetical protein VC899_24375 [Citrobacter braakii]|uniref:hypothetical protein n=1 Tax=Citrobacter braakii TaxID=57706 RepID=UPI002B253755|nr:hypothetical protein [Citrobacter braakii]MEB0968283.1 hypothetical protein [Citrobacter braakii]